MATVEWSGFWGDGVGSTDAYALLRNKMPRLNSIRRVVRRDGFRALTELADTLIGAAAGGAALATHSRIAAPSDGSQLGGARTVDTITDINRVSTAGDITALKEFLFGVKTAPTAYVVDLSGNGGRAFTPSA